MDFYTDLLTLLFMKATKSFIKYCKGTFNAFYFYLDLIKDCNSLDELPKFDFDAIYEEQHGRKIGAHIKTNYYYLLPFITVAINYVDTGLVFVRNNFKYNSTGMEDLFTHKIFPAELWYQGDGVGFMGVTTIMFQLGFLLFRPMLDPR